MSETILFVDDEEYILNSVERLFADSGMKILKAENADRALNFFSKEEIAVLVSDNQMPGIKGTELLSRVREISPDTMRILMTAHADLAVAVDAINKGEVFRFITKPWNDDLLVNAVQEAVSRYQIVLSLKNQDESKLLSIAQTIELKDPYTYGHCERVAQYASIIANILDFSSETKKNLKYSCWLHDCGKIGVPGNILNKKGALDKNEFGIIMKHPRWGADVVKHARMPEIVIDTILYHHEKYDGSGYPAGISGINIPLEARVITIADVFDALTSERPYREKYSDEKAIEVMLSMKSSFFDPELFDIFLHNYSK